MFLVRNKVKGVLTGVGVMLLVTGCASAPEVSVCTDIGAPPGVSVTVAGALAQEATSGTLSVCAGGQCDEVPVQLFPGTAVGEEICEGEGPDSSCSVQMVPSGELQGFTDVPDLPEGNVKVLAVLLDETGTEIFTGDTFVETPMVYPNGPECGGKAVQGSVRITESGISGLGR